jgi:hypothetical protein
MKKTLQLFAAATSLALGACATESSVMNITYPFETGPGYNRIEYFEIVTPGPVLEQLRVAQR